MVSSSSLNQFVSLNSAELIENVKLIHKPVSLQPRGLINKGNWCYINAVSFDCLNHVNICGAWLKPVYVFRKKKVTLAFVALLPCCSLTVKHSDPTGFDCMSSHVSPDEVNSFVRWNTEVVHLHTNDGQFVSRISVIVNLNCWDVGPMFFSFFHIHCSGLCLSVKLVNEFSTMPVPSKVKQQGKVAQHKTFEDWWKKKVSENYQNLELHNHADVCLIITKVLTLS